MWGMGTERAEGTCELEACCLKEGSVDLITFCLNQWMKWLKQPEFKNNIHLFISSFFKKRLNLCLILVNKQGVQGHFTTRAVCASLTLWDPPLFHLSSVPIHIPEY